MRRLWIVLLSVSVFSALTACSTEPQYSFPLSQKDLEQVISEQQLQWNVEEAQSFDEDHSVYSLRNDDRFFCAVESRGGVNGERSLSILLHYPIQCTDEQIRQFNEQELPRLFELAGTLYGNKREAGRICRGFSNYIEGYNSGEDAGIYLPVRSGENHILLRISSLADRNSMTPVTGSFSIKNSAAYERSNSASVKAWVNNEEEGYTKPENSTVADILTIKQIYRGNTVVRFIVRGQLVDIRKADLPESFNMTDEALNPNKEGYLVAELTDDTGSVEVFLRPTSLNAEELSRERDHCLHIYNTEDRVCVIIRSVLTDP